MRDGPVSKEGEAILSIGEPTGALPMPFNLSELSSLTPWQSYFSCPPHSPLGRQSTDTCMWLTSGLAGTMPLRVCGVAQPSSVALCGCRAL